MNYSELIDEIQKEFHVALEIKTNWGRNEIKMIFDKVIIKVLSRYLER